MAAGPAETQNCLISPSPRAVLAGLDLGAASRGWSQIRDYPLDATLLRFTFVVLANSLGEGLAWHTTAA
jgi:hypothetical protein